VSLLATASRLLQQTDVGGAFRARETVEKVFSGKGMAVRSPEKNGLLDRTLNCRAEP
jgi:hypothetical protein